MTIHRIDPRRLQTLLISRVFRQDNCVMASPLGGWLYRRPAHVRRPA
jgi:hypothetical protein